MAVVGLQLIFPEMVGLQELISGLEVNKFGKNVGILTDEYSLTTFLGFFFKECCKACFNFFIVLQIFFLKIKQNCKKITRI